MRSIGHLRTTEQARAQPRNRPDLFSLSADGPEDVVRAVAAGSLGMTRQRTSSPRSRSALTTLAPNRPVAPVTKILLIPLSLLFAAEVRRSRPFEHHD